MRSDNGTEFVKEEFVALLGHHGTRREYTPIDSPKHNGVTKRCISMTLKLSQASCLEAPRLFGGMPLPLT